MTAAAPRYKDMSMQNVYETLLVLAEDKTSEMYLSDGGQHRGANVMPNTMSSAAFQAGKEFAVRQRKQQNKGTPLMTASAPASAGKIEVSLFDKPSDGLRGVAIAMQAFKGKEKRIAHAYIQEGGAAKVTVTVPNSMTVEETAAVSATLARFVAKVKELEAPATAEK